MSEIYFYSAKTGGFYPESIKASYQSSPTGWPTDAVAISDEDYNALLYGQSQGKIIATDSNGKPILRVPVTDWQAMAGAKRRTLLLSANTTVADWRTELQLDIITDDDKSRLVKWIAYIKALKSLTFNGVTDEASYKNIEWPVEPGNSY